MKCLWESEASPHWVPSPPWVGIMPNKRGWCPLQMPPTRRCSTSLSYEWSLLQTPDPIFSERRDMEATHNQLTTRPSYCKGAYRSAFLRLLLVGSLETEPRVLPREAWRVQLLWPWKAAKGRGPSSNLGRDYFPVLLNSKLSDSSWILWRTRSASLQGPPRARPCPGCFPTPSQSPGRMSS